jgi:hypothetical protein
LRRRAAVGDSGKAAERVRLSGARDWLEAEANGVRRWSAMRSEVSVWMDQSSGPTGRETRPRVREADAWKEWT